MQQRTRRLAMVFGGTLLATVGVLTACSTDNGTTPLPGAGTDSGRDTGKKDGADNTEKDGDTSNPKDGGGADCSEVPRVRSNATGGFYCSFYKRDAAAPEAGGDRNCSNDETCCNPGKVGNDNPDSFCATTPRDEKGGTNGATECAAQAAANGSSWPDKSASWECADNQACDNGQVCCLFTWKSDDPMDKVNIGNSLDEDIPKACNAKWSFKQGGTRCAAACAANEIQLCSKEDDTCGGNTKCSPFSSLFRDLAYCN